MPKGLFTRALLIIVIPMVILQGVLAFLFMEKHYDLVTRRLAQAVIREVATIISVIETYPQDADFRSITDIAANDLGLSIAVLPLEPLPPPRPKPFFDFVDQVLSNEIRTQISRPFWIDTVGRSSYVEIRIQLKEHVLRVIARRSQTYASNSHIFIVWMVTTSLVLLVIALIFLRNQIKPIEQLANAAESFGKGRPIDDFRPRGALEVRRAAQAFIEMRRRIERQIEQRTTMLAGVSHDLRTILTRFRLQLALFGDSEETAALKSDVDDMNHMLEDYLAFARGDGDEQARPADLSLMFEDLEAEAEIAGAEVSSALIGETTVVVKPIAFKRCLTNLVTNAARYAGTVRIEGRNAERWLTITVEDDGPGIPPEERENVFRPFYRLDAARSREAGGSGLGLAIARDIARAHGGDILLDDSPLGGLRAKVRLPS
ncbi:ATP-binding protein [Stappia albiluteola]|nr:ATP-binding protein [Stappia albiluteola]